jgi:hypothetical protein
MAYTSGVADFNLDLSELVEEAYERAGLELRSGYDLRTARRSLNLLTIEWANRGINLWTIEQGQITVNTGQAIYPLPVDTIDLLDQVIRTGTGTGQVDINVSRISESTYSTIPTKNANGRPIQVWINRQTGESSLANVYITQNLSTTDTTIYISDISTIPGAGFITIDTYDSGQSISTEVVGYQNVVSQPTTEWPNGGYISNAWRGQNGTVPAASPAFQGKVYVNNLPCVNLWPTGDGGGPYTFVYWRMRRLQNAGDGVNVQDIPFRLIPCLVAGLAYMIAAKKPEVSPDRVMGLKSEYEQQWLLASQEDRDKSADRYVPRQMFY